MTGSTRARIEPVVGWVEPAGWRMVVPGFPQWRWRQRERGLVFLGSYLAALGAGLFAWGRPLGWLLTGFAFLIHVVSAADAIRQAAFPGFGRTIPVISAGAGLGLACYGPLAVAASIFAWPSEMPLGSGDGFLINRWAYRSAVPREGDWIWFNSPDGGRGVGRMLAEGGQVVEWSGGELRVGGRAVIWTPPKGVPHATDLVMTVPPGQVLVAQSGPKGSNESLLGFVFVDERAVLGRAWAQHSPVWSRRLLW